jgi:hypothetical protein
MPSLRIRDVPPDVYEALAARAKAENRSMAQQAIVRQAVAAPRTL